MRIDATDAAGVLGRALAIRPARELLSGGHAVSRLARGAVRDLALRPLARRLAGSPTLERRQVAALLSAAVDKDDYEAARTLAWTAGRRPDRRAEKIVSRRYRFLWICNPKAASRSLIAALRAADPGALLVRGRTLEQVLAKYPGARSYYRFAFVRHPCHRAYSFWADKLELARRDARAHRWFVEPYYGVTASLSFGDLCRWLNTPCGSDAFADRHWLSQSRQITTTDGRPPDFVGSCENLEADWRTLAERLGLPPTTLPRLNPRRRPVGPEKALDDEAIALLRRRYAADFRLGGYSDAP